MPKRPSRPALSEYRKKRNFARTPEPRGGAGPARSAPTLVFVIQKHAASRLHYDLRLEMAGVMRSWAVPKGPSLDPKIRRLAMEVEDHPFEYNDFEGTIPQGEYGGGTVMLWDHGTYVPDEIDPGEDPGDAVLRGYESGKLSITFHGQRLRGSFALVRTDRVEGGVRSRWLLLKHRDEHAEAGRDIAAEVTTSVVADRTMEEIGKGAGGERVWRSNRAKPLLKGAATTTPTAGRLPDPSALRPMLATTAREVPARSGWTYEPKYDGIRVLAFVTPTAVSLITRNGNDKARQFPEVVAALKGTARELDFGLVLDGELVALQGKRIARFEMLQGRMHLEDARRAERLAEETPAAFVAFDVLLEGDEVLIHQPWQARRERLEGILAGRVGVSVRLGETSLESEPLLRRGRREGWEGLIAKRTTARYRPGQRSADWLKLKLANRQEFIVGGWTEPRNSRASFGALLLGYYDEDGALIYAGHTGTGFTQQTLEQVHRRLRRLERKTPPFHDRPRTNAPAHWVTPRVVVEVRFNEWTRGGRLRQPVFVGLRQDKDPKEVVREPASLGEAESQRAGAAGSGASGGRSRRPRRSAKRKGSRTQSGDASQTADTVARLGTPSVGRIREIAQASGQGEVKLGGGVSLKVTNLGKTFFPETGHTKEDLLVYYAAMADLILPWMKDRPLVLKRFPNGVEGQAFYQQAAPDPAPPGVRVEMVDLGGGEAARLVGGNLATLLYTIQIGAISYDPWHSRVGALKSADYTILDLDPGPGADFARVVHVAGWVRDELHRLGLHGALKTSGSRGLHVYLPLPPRTPLEAATLVAQIIATSVAQKHPGEATLERMLRNRPHGTVYVDYLQNIVGKTVAGVYAVRAKSRPMVSTPISWDELDERLDPGDLTIDTVPARVERVGEIWREAMKTPNSLEKLLSRRT